MRLYRRSIKYDLDDTISLSDFDADHGRPSWALDRLRDLEQELGPHAKISYAEGLLRSDFLGQGKSAFDCFVRAQEIDSNHRLSACNAAYFAPSPEEFSKWAAIASGISPEDAHGFEKTCRALAEGVSYSELQLHRADASSRQSRHGDAAAHSELALTSGSLDESEEVKIRRARAQSLREVDREAQSLRESAGERFHPDERLSLHEAVLEIDRAISVDEHDAELWNLRSSWCVLLDRNGDAVAAATRAIALRPAGYAKPHHNMAAAYRNLGRDREAIETAKRAIEIASAAGNDADLKLAQALLDGLLSGRAEEEQFQRSAQKILKGVAVRTHQSAERMGGSVQDLFRAFAGRLATVRGGQRLEYVAPLAQLLAYCPVEVSATLLRTLQIDNPQAAELCSEALTYTIVNAERVMQRDAARVRSLLLLDHPDLERMRKSFRELVLIPAAAGSSEFRVLLDVVREQLLRLTDQGNHIVDNQPEPTDSEIHSTRTGLLQRLRGTPFINDSGKFGKAASQSPGCTATLLLVLLLSLALLAFLVQQ
jgi:tetratricopeptide (TPR) repeat protein